MSISVPIKIALLILGSLTLVQQGSAQAKMDSSIQPVDIKLTKERLNNRNFKYRMYLNLYGSKNNHNLDQVLKNQGFDNKQRNYSSSNNSNGGPFDFNLNFGKFGCNCDSDGGIPLPAVGLGMDFLKNKNFLFGVQYFHFSLVGTGFKRLYSIDVGGGVNDYGHRLIYELKSNLFKKD